MIYFTRVESIYICTYIWLYHIIMCCITVTEVTSINGHVTKKLQMSQK